MSDKEIWSYQLDWLNIIELLGLDSINQIPEFKKEKAIKKITKIYGAELLLTLKPAELDELVSNELRDLMKRELLLHSKRKEKFEKEARSKMAPFKKGNVIGINMSDLKDLDPNADPEEIFKYLSKKFLGNDEDEDDDDKKDRYDEDKTGYYI